VPPDPISPAIVHGDFKLDNVMLDATDVGHLVAVLDWEMSALGDPLVDVGILLAYWRQTAQPGQQDAVTSVTDRPGWATPADIVERYAARSGRDVSQMRFYETFAVFKIAVVIQQIFFRYTAGPDYRSEVRILRSTGLSPGAGGGSACRRRMRLVILAAFLGVLGLMSQDTTRKTSVTIASDAFHINGKPTYEGRTWQGHKIEGLLLNSRMVQATFDDLNPETRSRWSYPDTKSWDAERNTREFIAAMPEWRRHGLLAITVNLQGGSPQGYSKDQPGTTRRSPPPVRYGPSTSPACSACSIAPTNWA
jgi:hypothetical protein